MNKLVLDMNFRDLERLKIGDWLDKIKKWIKKAEEKLQDYELSSVTLNASISPSASITFSKKKQ